MTYWLSFRDGRPDTPRRPVEPGAAVKALLDTWQADEMADYLHIKMQDGRVVRFPRKTVH